MSSTFLASSAEVAPPTSAAPRPPYRLVAALAVVSSALLTVGTVLHPAHADPDSPAAAFAEYAGVGRGMWVAAHLLQLGGVAGLVLVVVLLARVVNGRRGSAWARVARSSAPPAWRPLPSCRRSTESHSRPWSTCGLTPRRSAPPSSRRHWP